MQTANWLRWRTPLFLFLVIGSNLSGDICLRLGLRHWADAHAILTLWVATGMTFYLIWLLAQMALFSWADLSYVAPITSIGYALAAIAGWLLLGEVISRGRWFGISLIVLGIVLVSRTPARTTNRHL
ncbi:MAG: hypothetical protein JWO80_4569 [Bryobacterales bacterium]|nr:hypothetical protein [Bryobacterales bacterium]